MVGGTLKCLYSWFLCFGIFSIVLSLVLAFALLYMWNWKLFLLYEFWVLFAGALCLIEAASLYYRHNRLSIFLAVTIVLVLTLEVVVQDLSMGFHFLYLLDIGYVKVAPVQEGMMLLDTYWWALAAIAFHVVGVPTFFHRKLLR